MGKRIPVLSLEYVRPDTSGKMTVDKNGSRKHWKHLLYLLPAAKHYFLSLCLALL